MKLPEGIAGRNKIRDSKICDLWVNESLSADDISEQFNLSERRIYQILRSNRIFVKIDKEWEKTKRIQLRNRWIKNRISKGESSKKDLDDLLHSNRIEIEGDKPLIDQSTHQHIQIYRPEPYTREEILPKHLKR